MNNNSLFAELMNKDPSFKIRINFDNKCSEIGFLTGFGFSALIYSYSTRDYLLFDTGGNGKILIHNINQFKINIVLIKKVIISHNHHDHTGGLFDIYNANKNIEVYVPFNDLNSFRKAFSGLLVHGVLGMTEIEDNIFSSGQFTGSFISEHCLILRLKNNELILLVGCSHPGLEKFILKARELGSIKGIIGGFHGFQNLSYLEGTEFIGACHCTQHIELIKQKFPKAFYKVCVGTTLIF
ncbi:MAG: MBL fold metallo-hydrolase [Promethearchaeota archaeon]